MEKIILVEPETPENTGFIARLAENFNSEIRIVKPEFNLSEARQTANTSQEKLRNAEIYNSIEKAVENLEYVVGTKPGRGRSLQGFKPPENTSIMIGRESSGLSNQELELCDTTIHIETGEKTSISQSHAAAILLHHTYTKEKQNEKTNIEMLHKIENDVGNVTLNLLKRSAPTNREIKAAISEIKKR